MSRTEPSPALEAVGLHKSFPGVQALAGVDFSLFAGEIHGLVGENGAGKSTLVRILSGLHPADSGHMRIEGHPFVPASRSDAEQQGVRIVLQELNLIDNLSIAENIFLERLPARGGIIDFRKLNMDARVALKQVGLDHLDPADKVGSLGAGQKQLVEVASGLSKKCRVFILDEPTATLAASEADLLFKQIRRLRDEGAAVIYISHRLEEVRSLADCITVLRDGKCVWTGAGGEISIPELVRHMVGREVGTVESREGKRAQETALKVVGLTRRPAVHNVSFEVRRGEILGFAGLAGSGRTETMRAIFGADRRDTGDIFLLGSEKPACIRSPRDAVKLGIAMLPEERRTQGLLLPQSVMCNCTLTHLRPLSRLGVWLRRTAEEAAARRLTDALHVKCAATSQRVMELSGGNQQKVVVAKWLHRNCEILICDEPTRGIDVGAKFEIYRLLADMAQQGKAVVLVSSDLNELIALCDRIAVMSCGHLADVFTRGEWTNERIMAAALSKHISASVSVNGGTSREEK